MTGSTRIATLALAALYVVSTAGLAACGADESPGTTTDTAGAGSVDALAAADVTADSGGGLIAPDAVNTFAYLVVEPTEIDFGIWPLGEIQTRDLELENAGDRALTLNRISLVQGTDVFASNAQQTLITPGEKKVIKVTFYALREGTFADALRFESNAINEARLDVPLSAVVSQSVCQDADNDQHGVGCPAGADCNDSDASVYVGAPELCNNLDDDCDGLHDEDFVGLGSSCEVGFGACVAAGVKICDDSEQGLRCSVNPVTGGDELCNDLDDDCDGATDEDFASKGKLCSVGEGACRVADKFVCSADATALVCNVTPKEPGVELCFDGIDNDCDGITDEGELEVCGDQVDNDCDGETDESGSAWGETFFARNWYSETVAIYPSNGDGSFGDAIPLDFGGTDRYSVTAVGDFDGDRYLDLIVSSRPTDGFTLCSVAADCPSGTRCAGGVCRSLCTSDAQCTGDDRCIDWSASSGAAINTYCSPPVPIYLARSSCGGDSGIGLTHLFDLAPGERLGPVIDSDGNGHLDFVGLHHWLSKVGFAWMNDGQGGFTKLTPAFNYATLFGPGANGYWQWAMVKTSKDLTGDGIVDMLGRSFTSGGSPPTDMWLFVGNGDGTFQPAVDLGGSVPRPSNMTTANDFDGDGDQDIVSGLDDDGQPGNTWMLLNLDSPQGTRWVNAYDIFDLVPSYNSGGEHPGVGNGTSFDFDGDEQPDILTAWVPEECGSYIWGCTNISDPGHICYGGSCRKVALVRNRTKNACTAGTSCVDGQCQPGCTADCSGKQCGGDGCGGTCGQCGGGQLCTTLGQCVVDCVPSCDGKACGDNGCGGICGQCAQGESCLGGQCTAGCIPNCSGRQCGDDGCGGRCAVFGDPEVIVFDDNAATNVEAPTNVPPTQPTVAITPADAAADDELTCAIAVASYDLDPVRYRIRWFRDGAFVKEIGNSAVVPAELTAAGQTWSCHVRATDGIEWSRPSEAQIVVGSP